MDQVLGSRVSLLGGRVEGTSWDAEGRLTILRTAQGFYRRRRSRILEYDPGVKGKGSYRVQICRLDSRLRSGELYLCNKVHG